MQGTTATAIARTTLPAPHSASIPGAAAVTAGPDPVQRTTPFVDCRPCRGMHWEKSSHPRAHTPRPFQPRCHVPHDQNDPQTEPRPDRLPVTQGEAHGDTRHSSPAPDIATPAAPEGTGEPMDEAAWPVPELEPIAPTPPRDTNQAIHAMGQRLWLDSISRSLIESGDLARHIDALSITGLTSNPTLFEQAIAGTDQYDTAIASLRARGLGAEACFYTLALEDLRAAADLFRPMFDATHGHDGWVSLEVSPLLVHDRAGTLAESQRLHALAARPNLFIKIPGTREGLAAMEQAVFDGIPVNVTLLFSLDDCVAAETAYLRALERRIEAGLDPNVASVASLFVGRWDRAANPSLPTGLHNRLGITVAMRALRDHLARLQQPRWQRVIAAGARPQRLLWASTGTKDVRMPPCHYLDALVADGTIDTLPLHTLQASAARTVTPVPMPEDGGDSATLLAEFRRSGLDIKAIALQLQREGIDDFTQSWQHLMKSIEDKA